MIDRAARGAWRDLETKLRPFIARRVPAEVDVDDVVQDVFLRMQRGLAGLRDEERFGAWVYQVARTAIVDHQRRAAKHPVADGEVLGGRGDRRSRRTIAPSSASLRATSPRSSPCFPRRIARR